MVRNVYRRVFPKHPVLGGFLVAASFGVLAATTAYATSPGRGVEGEWQYQGHNGVVCTVQRNPDYCGDRIYANTFCEQVSGGHHTAGTAYYNTQTNTCDTAHVSVNMNSATTDHIATVSTTGSEDPGGPGGGGSSDQMPR